MRGGYHQAVHARPSGLARLRDVINCHLEETSFRTALAASRCCPPPHRDRHFGEGHYEHSERVIQRLLGVEREPVTVEEGGGGAVADEHHLHTPEAILGDGRIELFASPGGATFERRTYQLPERLRTDRDACAYPRRRRGPIRVVPTFPGFRRCPAGGWRCTRFRAALRDKGRPMAYHSAGRPWSRERHAASPPAEACERPHGKTCARPHGKSRTCGVAVPARPAGVCLAARTSSRSGPTPDFRRRGVLYPSGG